MASAYVALLSLKSNIQQYQQRSLIFPENFQIEFLKESTTFLIQFFEEHHDSKINRQKILDLEMRTKYVATEADCMIDSHAMDQNQMLINHGYGADYSSQLFPKKAIHRIMKEFKSIKEKAKKIMMNVKKHQSQLSTCSVPATGPSILEIAMKSMIGFGHHLIAVMNCLEGFRMMDVESTEVQLSRGVDINTTMVGFDRHVLEVMGRITRHKSDLQILPIVGTGGIGKTTLTQNVYDNKLIEEHFQIRLWATVSQSYNVHDILLSFLHELNIVHENLPRSNK